MATTTPAGPRRSEDRNANSRKAREAAREAAARRRQVRATVVTVLVALVVLVGVGVAAFKPSGSSTSSAGYSANPASFDLPALTGSGHVRLADHKGRPVVVNFFASWCVYCNEELPGFVEVAKATKGQVDFIGVNTSETGDGAAMAARFDLAGAGFSLARDIGKSPASDLWSSFGAQGLPVTAFYNAEGQRVDFSGGMLTQAQLEQRLRADFGITVKAADAANLAAPVIPVIPMGAFELMRTNAGNPGFHVLDVRTPQEYAAGHLPGAVNINVESPDFTSQVKALDPSATYIVYCHTGNRSAVATERMHALGFKHIYDVQGGIAAWQAAGLPLGP